MVDTIESWGSYPSVFSLGHSALTHLFDDPVVVEEKIDGSQISFGLFPNHGGLRVKSKGAPLHVDAPMAMFERAIEVIRTLPLHPGWTYRAEYLRVPKHNVLAYDRTPKNHMILFDINDGMESYQPWEAKAEEADRLGLEIVPRLFQGIVTDVTMFRSLLDTPSVLGGQKIEGVVVKNYARFGPDKKVLIGKFVSEAFKEVHAAEWKNSNPSSGDIIDRLVDRFRTPARWQKAVQHLAEKGKLEGSPRDIGPLMVETALDVEKECKDEILAMIWSWAWPHLKRRVAHGLPDWWKERLLEKQFEAKG